MTTKTQQLDSEEMDTLVSEAERIFGDDIAEPVEPGLDGVTWDDAPVIASPEPAYRPSRDKMIPMRGGGQYLGVRQRLVWMRKEHPMWQVHTSIVEADMGNDDPKARWALFKAIICDENGQVVAQSHKREDFKDFADFAEKAETGAIGRALAVAGYGTENALELDEAPSARTGELRIADAPVTITPSAVPGIRQGGRSSNITTAQLQAIARRSKELDLGPLGLALFVADKPLIDAVNANEDQSRQQQVILDHLKSYSFDDAAQLLQRLTEAKSAA